jgi:hypothetical protein
MGIKVCHITSVHQPGDARIFVKECQSLAQYGYEVYFVFAASESSKEIVNGVTKIGVKRAGDGRINRFIKDTKNVIEAAKNTGATIFHFHDPELIPHAVKLHKRGNIVFYDAHEDLPLQVLSKHYIPSLIRKPIAFFASLLEKWMVKNCSAIVAATPSIQNKFLKLGANCITVHNFPRIDELLIDISSKPEHDFAVCYVGGIMATRGIYQLTDAMAELNCKMHLCGSFSPLSLRNEIVSKPGWENIIEHGFLSRSEVADVYRKCDVGVVTLLPSPNYIDAYPVKMFEYMAAGLAVVASDFPLYKSIVEDNQCGICVDPSDANAIKAAILSLSQNPELCKQYGINGQQMVKSKYNWNSEAEQLFKLYQTEILKAKIQ